MDTRVRTRQTYLRICACFHAGNALSLHPAALHLLPSLLEEHPNAAALAAQLLLSSPLLCTGALAFSQLLISLPCLFASRLSLCLPILSLSSTAGLAASVSLHGQCAASAVLNLLIHLISSLVPLSLQACQPPCLTRWAAWTTSAVRCVCCLLCSSTPPQLQLRYDAQKKQSCAQ